MVNFAVIVLHCYPTEAQSGCPTRCTIDTVCKDMTNSVNNLVAISAAINFKCSRVSCLNGTTWVSASRKEVCSLSLMKIIAPLAFWLALAKQ